jgi:hypothetical protein
MAARRGNPRPDVTGLEPASALAGSAGLALNIDGSNFVASSSVEWNGVELETTYVSVAQLSAQLPASDLANAGSAVVATVSNFDGARMISVTDTQRNTFMQLDQENDSAPGAQTVAHFYPPLIVSDASTSDKITVSWGNDDYKAVLIPEIGRVSDAPLVGHLGNLRDALPQGAIMSAQVALPWHPGRPQGCCCRSR